MAETQGPPDDPLPAPRAVLAGEPPSDHVNSWMRAVEASVRGLEREHRLKQLADYEQQIPARFDRREDQIWAECLCTIGKLHLLLGPEDAQEGLQLIRDIRRRLEPELPRQMSYALSNVESRLHRQLDDSEAAVEAAVHMVKVSGLRESPLISLSLQRVAELCCSIPSRFEFGIGLLDLLADTSADRLGCHKRRFEVLLEAGRVGEVHGCAARHSPETDREWLQKAAALQALRRNSQAYRVLLQAVEAARLSGNERLRREVERMAELLSPATRARYEEGPPREPKQEPGDCP